MTSFTGHTTAANNHKQEIGISAGFGLGEDPTDDGVLVRINPYQTSQNIIFSMLARDGSTKNYSTAYELPYSSVTTPTTFYLELIKDGNDHTLNIYDDSAYSNSLGTVSVTQSGITGLQYYSHQLFTQATNGVTIGSVDNFKFYDGMSSGVSAGAPPSNIKLLQLNDVTFEIGTTTASVGAPLIPTPVDITNLPSTFTSGSVGATSRDDMYFSQDGLHLVTADGVTMYSYDLGTAWDISSITSQTGSKSTGHCSMSGIAMNNDGSKVYPIDYCNATMYEYSLSTPYDISSGSQGTSKSVGGSVPVGAYFKSDGLQLWVADQNPDSIRSYTLGTAWDLSTLSSSVYTLTLDSQNPEGMAFAPDGLSFYIGYNSNDVIKEYNLSTAWDISTVTSTNSWSINYPSATRTSGLFVSDDGGSFYVMDSSRSDVIQYTMAGGTGGPIISATTSDNTSSPQHYVFTRDGNDWSIYQNGAQVGSTVTDSTSLGASSSSSVTSFTGGTTDAGYNSNLKGGGNQIQAGNDLVGKTITSLGFYFKNTSPTLTIGVFDNTSGTVSCSMGTVTSSGSSYQLYEVTNASGCTVSADQVLGFHSGTGNLSGFNSQRYNSGSGAEDTQVGMYWATSSGSNWQPGGDAQDYNMKVTVQEANYHTTNISGILDEFFINSDVLTATEIESIKNRGTDASPITTSSTSYNDNTVVAGNEYFYKVYSLSSVGLSTASNIDNAQTVNAANAPAGVTATNGVTQANVSPGMQALTLVAVRPWLTRFTRMLTVVHTLWKHSLLELVQRLLTQT